MNRRAVEAQNHSPRSRPSHATFRNTSAEFFDPNAMQLHTACSIVFFRPASLTTSPDGANFARSASIASAAPACRVSIRAIFSAICSFYLRPLSRDVPAAIIAPDARSAKPSFSPETGSKKTHEHAAN